MYIYIYIYIPVYIYTYIYIHVRRGSGKSQFTACIVLLYKTPIKKGHVCFEKPLPFEKLRQGRKEAARKEGNGGAVGNLGE